MLVYTRGVTEFEVVAAVDDGLVLDEQLVDENLGRTK